MEDVLIRGDFFYKKPEFLLSWEVPIEGRFFVPIFFIVFSSYLYVCDILVRWPFDVSGRTGLGYEHFNTI